MIRPPVAARVPHHYTRHGITVEDPYAWLKDPAYPDVTDQRVLDYLTAENAYFEACMQPHQALIGSLFDELKARQPQQDSSVPYRKDGYWYQWRFDHGAQYRTWLRAPVTGSAPPAEDDPAWRVILDEPALAEEHNYFVLGGLSVSPNGRYLAWNADTNGSERFLLHVKDLEDDVLIDEPVPDTLASPVWTADNGHFFYVAVNRQWRPYQVRLHKLGTPRHDDPVVYEESVESFFVGIDQTTSDAYVLISTGDHVTSEIRYLPADDPYAEPRLVAARRTGHEYSMDHGDGYFYFMSNAAHKNFALYRASEVTPEEAHWETMLAGSDGQYLTSFARFHGRLVISERIVGLEQVRIIEDGGADYLVEFPEPTHTVSLGANAEYDTAALRVLYHSMVTPETEFDFHFAERRLEALKTQQIPTGYQPRDYVTERLTAEARDGARVPVSIVYRKDLPRDGSAPLYLYGYGAYGMATMPGFSTNRLSLLDRGFAFAIAHIRGGDDLGYAWYEDGKLDKRTNTFNDFVDVARFLIAEGYSSAGRIAIAGGSAGGELMGAVVNQAPELWGAVVAHVPFMDVLNTMLDASLPLTPIEWPEWGNPITDKAAFTNILSYSPYDQLTPGAYPPMLVTAGLNDPRVTYWEPAKYVAKLRTMKTDDNWLLLKTNMDAGHRGQSGRFESLQELAEEYAFILVSLKMV
jgi:oligopeptidase B